MTQDPRYRDETMLVPKVYCLYAKIIATADVRAGDKRPYWVDPWRRLPRCCLPGRGIWKFDDSSCGKCP